MLAATALAIVALGLHGGWTVGGIVGPLVGAGVAILIGLGYRSLARESQEREQLMAELIATRDQLAETEHESGVLAERARLAREIHDTVAQGLSSIQMLLHAAEREAPDGPGVEYVRLARDTAATNLVDARRFVRELTPAALVDQGIGAALRRLAETQWSSDSLDVHVRVSDAIDLPIHVQTALLRIAQGAMANVVQHADARTRDDHDRPGCRHGAADHQRRRPRVRPGRRRRRPGLRRLRLVRPHCRARARRPARRKPQHRRGARPRVHRLGRTEGRRRRMIRLVIADDHPVVRAGLRALLDHEDGITVVGEASTPDEAVELAERENPDLVLMDLQFGADATGAEATRRIRELEAPPYVLVLTNYDTDGDILSAVEAGASGYLLKDAPPAELIAAVRAAASGESALAPAIAGRLLNRMRAPQISLSRREIEVLDQVAAGRSNSEIAAALVVSETTVKSHLVHIFSKLDVSSRTAAVSVARQLGILR